MVSESTASLVGVRIMWETKPGGLCNPNVCLCMCVNSAGGGLNMWVTQGILRIEGLVLPTKAHETTNRKMARSPRPKCATSYVT